MQMEPELWNTWKMNENKFPFIRQTNTELKRLTDVILLT